MLRANKSSSLVIHNAVEMHEEVSTEANGKGRKFVSRFIEAGLAHYEQFGDVLITKETLDKFIHTLIGCPVIIKHKDITDKNADRERVGVISNVWFNELDGWFYCDGIIWDKQAIDLVKNQGWNVSCTYDFESDFVKGTYHGKPYDMEFTGGKFLHLALVPNPRYERATIVMNSKDKEYQMLIENKDDENGRWVTIKGTHVFIPDGKQIEDVMKEKGWIEEGKSTKGKPEEDNLKGKYERDDVEFDEKQAQKDIQEAKKRGYDTVEKIAEYLGLDEDEVRGFEGTSDAPAHKFDDDDFAKWSSAQKSKDKGKGETITVKGKRLYIPEGKKAQDVIRKEFGNGTEGDQAIRDYETLKDIHQNQEDVAEYQKRQEQKGEGKGEEGKKTAKGNKPVDISKFQFKNYKNPEGQNRKGYETYKSSFESISKETEHVPEKVKKQYNGNTPPYKAARTEFSHINDNASARDLMDSWTNRNKDYKPVIDAILERQNTILEELKPYNKWNGKEWVKSADNSIQSGFSERIQNSLVEVIADAICDEVCNSADFFV